MFSAPSPRSVVVSLCLSITMGCLALGCTCSADKPPPPPPETPAPSVPSLPPGVDRALLSELEAAAAECEAKEARVTCAGGKKSALVLAFNRGTRDRAGAIATFAYALGKKEPRLTALCSSVLYAAFRTGFGRDVSKLRVAEEDARSLLDSALSLEPTTAMQAIPAAVHAMNLSGQYAELDKRLTSQIPVQVVTMAHRYLMVYGRLQAFARVQEASRAPGTALVLSAIESPRNMTDWSDEERAAICPWAETFLEDERPAVVGNSLAVLSHCRGETLDVLLTRIEKTLRDKQFSFIHSTALRDACGPDAEQTATPAAPAQCGKVRELQERAARSKDIEPRVRAMTLANCAYDHPDKKSLALAKGLADDPAPEVSRAAEQVLRRLESLGTDMP